MVFFKVSILILLTIEYGRCAFINYGPNYPVGTVPVSNLVSPLAGAGVVGSNNLVTSGQAAVDPYLTNSYYNGLGTTGLSVNPVTGVANAEVAEVGAIPPFQGSHGYTDYVHPVTGQIFEPHPGGVMGGTVVSGLNALYPGANGIVNPMGSFDVDSVTGQLVHIGSNGIATPVINGGSTLYPGTTGILNPLHTGLTNPLGLTGGGLITNPLIGGITNPLAGAMMPPSILGNPGILPTTGLNAFNQYNAYQPRFNNFYPSALNPGYMGGYGNLYGTLNPYLLGSGGGFNPYITPGGYTGFPIFTNSNSNSNAYAQASSHG